MNFDNYDEVFTPSHPVTFPDFFVGREQEVVDLKRGLKRKGEFPVVVGNRGVGKTSLVSLGLKEHGQAVVKTNCFEGMTFHDLSRALLMGAGVTISLSETTQETRKKVHGGLSVFNTGVTAEGEQKNSEKNEGLSKIIWKPWDLYRQIRDLKKGITFVIDEYDRIDPNDQAIHSSVADLLKATADNTEEHNFRFVIVGISDSAAALLGKHRSIERSAKEIYVRPLRNEDINTFLSEAESKLKFKFMESVKQKIVHYAMGYPYYVHLVGVNAIDAMVDRLGNAIKNYNERIVNEEDYVNSLKKAVSRAFQSNLAKYREGMRSLNRDEIEVIKFLSLVDDRTAITRHQLWDRLKKIVTFNETEFDSILLRLQQEKKVLHIGRSTNFVRLSDPLMAPFLRSWYFKEKLIPYSAKSNLNQIELFGDNV